MRHAGRHFPILGMKRHNKGLAQKFQYSVRRVVGRCSDLEYRVASCMQQLHFLLSRDRHTRYLSAPKLKESH